MDGLFPDCKEWFVSPYKRQKPTVACLPAPPITVMLGKTWPALIGPALCSPNPFGCWLAEEQSVVESEVVRAGEGRDEVERSTANSKTQHQQSHRGTDLATLVQLHQANLTHPGNGRARRDHWPEITRICSAEAPGRTSRTAISITTTTALRFPAATRRARGQVADCPISTPSPQSTDSHSSTVIRYDLPANCPQGVPNDLSRGLSRVLIRDASSMPSNERRTLTTAPSLPLPA
ncbi:hypothetical protein BU16DRAFT_618032 [Lophium mytilinum]|uniref:Uncharacterized protein n=1 Tax=Lophium mytilinum TaxID=390894 RepID=A0A6A6QS19_9PEZI|nr:hypothetical protein BU16DRAFT_618032 [Lophium mytilinum]